MYQHRPYRRLPPLSPHAALLAAAVVAALTAPVAAQLQFEELPRKGLPPSSAGGVMALGDVDGDGDLDMVWGHWNQQNRLYLNDGTGTFTDATATHMPVYASHAGYTSSLAFGDVDGDGDLDIVLGNSINCTLVGCYGGQNRLYLNNGSGTFTDATATHMWGVIDNTSSVVLGDVDGDGDLDMVVGNSPYFWWGGYYWGSSRLYLNSGSGTFTAAGFLGVNAYSVALGDVDGDGDLDFVSGNGYYTTGRNQLYLNNGAGTFANVTTTQMPVSSHETHSVALGDVDGDGDLDMVCGNSPFGYPASGGQNRLYLNDGTGTFSDATASRMPVDNDSTSSVALGDVDGDGDLDMVCGNNGSQDRLYVNNGSGTFTDATAASLPVSIVSTISGALGDVDGDGDIDFVSGNWQQNRLYLNLQRQLHAPTAPQIGQPYTLDAYMRYGTSTVANFSLAYLSTAPDSIASMFGTIGLDLAAAVPFPALIVPQPAGFGSIGFTVPYAPSLVGQPIYCQSMLVAYPFDLRLSNVVADVIQ